MALGRGSLVRRLTRRGPTAQDTSSVERIEERKRTLSRATEQWLSLLREMEHAGQTGEARYETYYRAYLQSKEQQKRVDLELFNVRRGLTS